MSLRSALVLTVVVAAGTAGMGAQANAPLSAEQAERCYAKALSVAKRPAASPTSTAEPVRTVFTEPELNSYLKYKAPEHLPSGVADPVVTLVGPGRLAGRVQVDLDNVRKKSSGGWLDPTSYLSGRLPVTVSGTLVAANGVGRFNLETAEVSGVPVPKTLIQELLSYYTRSAETPDGVRLDQAFDLPAGIDRIEIREQQATVVQ
jgi:hypothetical protein